MTLTPKPNGYEVRLRYGKGQRDRFLLRCDEPTALDREPRMEAMARKLSALADDGKRARGLLEEAASVAADEKKFSAVERTVDKICAAVAGTPPPATAGALSSFRDVAEAWTSGRLTELYPDHESLPAKDTDSRKEDRALVATFYPALGSKPVATITQDDVDAARRLIPKGAHPNTRRKYLLKLRMVLRLSVSPLRLVEKTVDVDIPRRRASNLFGYLYPQEEALLLAHTPIPLVYRVLYGYLARNGCRIGESLQLTWDHVDLETGDIHVDKRWTKTKRARRWVLDADVLEALEAYHRVSGSPDGKALVFPGRAKKRLTHGAIRKRFTKDLRLAGVARRSILEGADGIDPLRVHDLRASFVTLALRAGRDLKWIMTRTGHETLGVLKVYDRLVQDANEHHLPKWFSPMAQAIPELRPKRAKSVQGGPGVGQYPEFAGKTVLIPRSQGTDEPGETEAKDREIPPSVTSETPLQPTSGPASFQGVGQTGPGQGGPATETVPEVDPVEKALAFAIEEATRDKRWDVVLTCTRELEQRRLARASSNVKSLADHRRDKGGK